MEFIDLKTQYQVLKEPIDARIARVLEHGRFILGPEVGELESRLSEFVGIKHTIAVASGTDALLIAMMALGVSAGDEIITTPFSFIAVAEMIALLGATPIFVDIDARTYNIDPHLLERAITARTKAIVPVSLYGQCADLDAINDVALGRAIPVIEDAAQSFGATYKGRRSCSLSTIGCTSFFPSKPLGCYGDGGACFTDDEDIARRMREIHVHGQGRRYHHSVIGVNGRMDTIQAAVLLAKLEHYDEEIAARQLIAARYSERLRTACTQITVPYIEPHNLSVYAQYTVQLDRRDEVVLALTSAGVPTAVHYPVPLHRQPVFSHLRVGAGGYPVSEAVAGRVLSLPMHRYLSERQQDEIVAVTAAALNASCTV